MNKKKGGTNLNYRNEIMVFAGTIGSIVSLFIDFFGLAVVVLFALMLLDYFSGMLVYASLGQFDVKKAARGLLIKVWYLIVVSATYLLGVVITPLDFAGNGLAIAFAVLEFISIVDNGYKLNAGMPKFLTRIIETAKKEIGEDEKNNEKTSN